RIEDRLRNPGHGAAFLVGVEESFTEGALPLSDNDGCTDASTQVLRGPGSPFSECIDGVLQGSADVIGLPSVELSPQPPGTVAVPHHLRPQVGGALDSCVLLERCPTHDAG